MAKKLKGIDGWLLLYLIIGILIGIHFIVIALPFIHDFILFGVRAELTTFGVLIYGLCWLYGVNLILREKKKAIVFNKYLLRIGIGAYIIILLIALIGFDSFCGWYSCESSDYMWIIGIILFYFISTQYLNKSKRVKNTLVKN